MFKYSVPISQKTPTFPITKINRLIFSREIIDVYCENRIKHMWTKWDNAADSKVGDRPTCSNHCLKELRYIPIYIQQDATLHSLCISGNCSTCFGWYLHPSSGAHTTVSTASGICHTVTDNCRYRGRVGTGLSVLWVASRHPQHTQTTSIQQVKFGYFYFISCSHMPN